MTRKNSIASYSINDVFGAPETSNLKHSSRIKDQFNSLHEEALDLIREFDAEEKLAQAALVKSQNRFNK